MQRIPPTLLLLAIPAAVAAQGAPPRRAHHAIVYDEARERILLSGGSSPFEDGNCCAMFNDLWSFDGRTWTALTPSGTPMSGMRFAFDTSRRRVVSYGGYSNGRTLADVRALEGDAWVSLGQHLPAAEPGLVYDTRRNRFVAFGGSAGRGQAHGDTWEFDGTRWSKAEVAGPPPRQAFVMVYDERRGRTVVFGGSGVSTPPTPGPVYGDLWEYDGRTWTQVTAPGGPSARFAAGAAYDSRRGQAIIFGGLTPAGSLGDTWAWDGRTWTKLADAEPGGPEPRSMGALAYDRKRDRVVLFGGRKGWPNDLNDTWEWDGTAWRRIGS